MSQSIFSNFTNLYSISKTLKMELVPTDTTKTFLEINNFENDKTRSQNYAKIKVMFDKLHRKFISDSLRSVDIDFGDFLVFYKDFIFVRQNRKTRAKEWEVIQKEMNQKLLDYRKIIVAKFNQYGEMFKNDHNRELILANPSAYKKPPLADKGYKVLTEKAIMEVLKYEAIKNNNPEDLAVIGSFDNFFTYFGSFNQTRENLYKDDGTATAIATRLIDDNLIRFCDNIILWKELNGKYNLHNIPEINVDLFDIKEYSKFLTQVGIDIYNGNQKTQDLNLRSLHHNKTLINRFLQNQSEKVKESKFKDLYKVMLTERESYITQHDETTIMEVIKKFDTLATATLPTISSLIPNLENFELDKIWLKSSSISDLSARYCGGQNWDLLAIILKNLGYGKTEKGETKLDKFVQLSAIKEAFGKMAIGQIELKKEPKNPKTSKSKKANTNNTAQIKSIFDEQKTISNTNQTENQPTSQSTSQSAVYFAKDIFLSFYFEAGNTLEGQENNWDLWAVFVQLLQNDWNKLTNDFGHYQQQLSKEILSQSVYTPAKPTSYEQKNEGKDKNNVSTLLTQANLVKKYADTVLGIWNTIRLFELSHNKKSEYANYDHDASFYDPLQNYLMEFPAFGYYNDLRNFSTKKAFKTDKFKLNFDNSTLLNGWDINKESDNTGIIIRSGNKYELLILDKTIKGNNQLFKKTTKNPIFSSADQGIWKMEYKLLTDVAKSIPKCSTQLKKVINHFKNSYQDFVLEDKNNFIKPLIITKSEFEINNRIYNKNNILESVLRDKENDTDEKGFVKVMQKGFVKFGGDENTYKFKVAEWINFGKKFLNSYASCEYFDFSSLKETKEYESIDEFYKDIDRCSYTIKFVPLNPEVLIKYEQEGKIYRFQIKNKDWNDGATGTKNMQTIYFENLFDADNLANTVYKLNGEAEVFIRPKSIDKKTQTRNTKTIITANKRYTEDKMFLHLPININFSSQNITKYNDFLKTNLTDNLTGQKPNYLGIDRGENNLLYCVLIDSTGKILMQKSLNTLGGQDYEKLLNAKQEERKQAKESWSAIENIKNLKSGYLSLAVYEICKIAFENNALIVLENLNFGFKKSRTAKFEKSIYQKFEVALATKLQHLFFKNTPKNQLGGSLNALQLCPPLDITTIDKVNQWGIINYVVASYTSRICPLTGWHKTVYIKDNLVDIKNAFNSEMDGSVKIGWDTNLKCYTFKDSMNTVYAHSDLIRNVYDKNTKNTRIITGTEIHDNLNQILSSFDKDNINDQIQNSLGDRQWKELQFYYNLITNIRVKKLENNLKLDIIQSTILCTPDNCVFAGVTNSFEPFFFDTQKAREQAIILGLKIELDSQNKEIIPLPTDGDANGSYHIAKKGLDD